MTNEDRIVDLFRQNKGTFFCDACVQKQLLLGNNNRTMARNATATLGAVPEYFDREKGRCARCQNPLRFATRWRV